MLHLSMRVAFIQNRVQLGGRFQVTFEMTKVLNSMGIVPDFYSYRFRLSIEDIYIHYGSSIKINFHTIPEPKLPFEWNITQFNRQISPYVDGYDLVINSNNTSLGLSERLNLISYIHYPRKARLMNSLSIGRLFKFNKDPLMLNVLLYRWHTSTHWGDLQVANSKFTAEKFEEHYSNEVKTILYPPVDTRPTVATKMPNRIVSLGRFSPNKRQLEQIQMMAELPSHELYIIGFKNDVAYFNKCQQVIEELWLNNVHLISDATEAERDSILASSSFFIHSLRDEPFGITTVQGIAAGCIPIVHNSGGQKEIVQDVDLRFESENEIPGIIRNIQSTNRISGIKKGLQQHIKAYDISIFRRQFKSLIEQKLPKS